MVAARPATRPPQPSSDRLLQARNEPRLLSPRRALRQLEFLPSPAPKIASVVCGLSHAATPHRIHGAAEGCDNMLENMCRRLDYCIGDPNRAAAACQRQDSLGPMGCAGQMDGAESEAHGMSRVSRLQPCVHAGSSRAGTANGSRMTGRMEQSRDCPILRPDATLRDKTSCSWDG